MSAASYDPSAARAAAARHGLSAPIEAAAVALVRLDERLVRGDGALADGFAARTVAFDAQAIVTLAGGLAPLEDIVLHDADMDVRAPTLDVIRAVSVLNLRRSFARRAPEDLLSPGALVGLIGLPGAGQPAGRSVEQPAGLPPLVRETKSARWRWRPDRAPQARLAGLLAAMNETARLGNAELDRLTLACAVMHAKCAGKSKNSRLPELVDLFLAGPLVSVQLAAKALKVSPQGIENMLASLGTARPREITGRKRYRAWGIL